MQREKNGSCLLSPKEKVYNLPQTQIIEQNYHQTSLQYYINSPTPSNSSQISNPFFLQSLGNKSERPFKKIEQIINMAQSVVIEAYQSNFTELNADDKRYHERIKEVQDNCEMCQSAMINDNKTKLGFDWNKIKLLWEMVKQLKSEKQSIKNEITMKVKSLSESTIEWKKELQKKLTSRLNYQISTKNSQIKNLQDQVQKLIEKLYSLQSQNQQLRSSYEIKIQQLSTLNNQLTLELKINERQLKNVKQTRKQLQSRLIQKQSFLISLQAAKQNLQELNANLYEQVRILLDRLKASQPQLRSLPVIQQPHQSAKEYIKKKYNLNRSFKDTSLKNKSSFQKHVQNPISGFSKFALNIQPKQESSIHQESPIKYSYNKKQPQLTNKSYQSITCNSRLANKKKSFESTNRGQMKLYQSQNRGVGSFGRTKIQSRIKDSPNISQRVYKHQSPTNRVQSQRKMKSVISFQRILPSQLQIQEESLQKDSSNKQIDQLKNKIEKLRTDLQDQIRLSKRKN